MFIATMQCGPVKCPLDCGTKAETPLYRPAAFGSEETVEMLLDAGAKVDAKDMNGDCVVLEHISSYL